MLSLISFLEWLRLAIAFVLFIGPGLALTSFYPWKSKLDIIRTIVLGTAFSFSFWAILLAWLNLASIRLNLNGVVSILIAGWVIFALRLPRSFPPHTWKASGFWNLNRLTLWSAVGLSLAANLFALQGVFTGPGSDTYHHTMIIQLFIDQGGIPDNYLPYADLLTFQYHYAFHAFAYVLKIFSNLELIFIAPIAEQILAALTALTCAYLAESATGSKRAAALAAILVGLVMVFPAYLINWGRSTQMAALFLLPMFLSELMLWKEHAWDPGGVIPLAVLAAGLSLSHYRLTIIASIAALIFLALSLIHQSRSSSGDLKALISGGLKALPLALVLVLPWLIHVLAQREIGYLPKFGSTVEPSFFSLARLGMPAVQFPTNYVILPILCISVITGWFKRRFLVQWLSLWAITVFLLSFPQILGVYMDTVTSVITIFVIFSVLNGWFLDFLIEKIESDSLALNLLIALPFLALASWGTIKIVNIIQPGNDYIEESDLPAFQWIESNTDPASKFLINTYEFPFLPGWVVGLDAGYWLPLLTGRETTVPPMIYTLERSSNSELVRYLKEYNQVQFEVDSRNSLQFLSENHFNYIYCSGERGYLDPAELQMTPGFELVYMHGGVQIFAIETN